MFGVPPAPPAPRTRQGPGSRPARRGAAATVRPTKACYFWLLVGITGHYQWLLITIYPFKLLPSVVSCFKHCCW